MRILLVVSMVPQADGIGAIPKLLHAQLTGLRERHDVSLVGSFGELAGQADAAHALMRLDPDTRFLDRRRSRSPSRRWRVRAELAATWIARPWPWRAVCATAGLQPILDQLVDQREFDVIDLEESLMSVLALPADTPTVLTEHEAFHSSEDGWRGGPLRERPASALRIRDWRRWSDFRRAAWEKTDLIQVYSKGDAVEIKRLAPRLAERVRVNPFGLTIPDPVDPAHERPSTVLFTGTFTHLPNRDAAVWLATEIMPAVRALHPQAHLRLVGTAPPSEVRALVGPGVELIADAASIEPHLAEAALIVAPVRGGGGMRMKVLEAMAHGKAVVTTPRGAEGFDCFDKPPPLALGADAPAIAGAIAALLGDEPARRDLGGRARDFAVAHLNPSAWAARLECVYEEARETRRAGT